MGYADVKNILELLYLLSGPILAVLVAWGLQQITVAKKNSKLIAKREAFRVSAEQCTRFMESIIPKMNECDKIRKTMRWEWLEEKVEIEILDNGFKFRSKAPPQFTDHFYPLIVAALDVLNSLESFAIFFTTGVASEQLAYTSVATTYCDQVKGMMPIIAIGAIDQKHFRHLLKLFFLWNNRLKSEQLFLTKERIEKKIKEIGDKTIIPMGLE